MEVEDGTSFEALLFPISRWLRQREQVSKEEGFAAKLRYVDTEEHRMGSEDERAVGEPELGMFRELTRF